MDLSGVSQAYYIRDLGNLCQLLSLQTPVQPFTFHDAAVEAQLSANAVGKLSIDVLALVYGGRLPFCSDFQLAGPSAHQPEGPSSDPHNRPSVRASRSFSKGEVLGFLFGHLMESSSADRLLLEARTPVELLQLSRRLFRFAVQPMSASSGNGSASAPIDVALVATDNKEMNPLALVRNYRPTCPCTGQLCPGGHGPNAAFLPFSCNHSGHLYVAVIALKDIAAEDEVTADKGTVMYSSDIGAAVSTLLSRVDSLTFGGSDTAVEQQQQQQQQQGAGQVQGLPVNKLKQHVAVALAAAQELATMSGSSRSSSAVSTVVKSLQLIEAQLSETYSANHDTAALPLSGSAPTAPVPVSASATSATISAAAAAAAAAQPPPAPPAAAAAAAAATVAAAVASPTSHTPAVIQPGAARSPQETQPPNKQTATEQGSQQLQRQQQQQGGPPVAATTAAVLCRAVSASVPAAAGAAAAAAGSRDKRPANAAASGSNHKTKAKKHSASEQVLKLQKHGAGKAAGQQQQERAPGDAAQPTTVSFVGGTTPPSPPAAAGRKKLHHKGVAGSPAVAATAAGGSKPHTLSPAAISGSSGRPDTPTQKLKKVQSPVGLNKQQQQQQLHNLTGASAATFAARAAATAAAAVPAAVADAAAVPDSDKAAAAVAAPTKRRPAAPALGGSGIARPSKKACRMQLHSTALRRAESQLDHGEVTNHQQQQQQQQQPGQQSQQEQQQPLQQQPEQLQPQPAQQNTPDQELPGQQHQVQQEQAAPDGWRQISTEHERLKGHLEKLRSHRNTDRWAGANGIANLASASTAGPMVAAGVVSELVAVIGDSNSTSRTRAAALGALANITCYHNDARSMVADEPGFLSLLVKLLASKDTDELIKATQLLANVTCSSDDAVLAAVVQKGAVQSAATLLSGVQHATNIRVAVRHLIQEAAAILLGNLAHMDAAAVATEAAIKGLINALQSTYTSSSSRASIKLQVDVARALCNTTECSAGAALALQEGAVQHLLNLMESTDASCQEWTVLALQHLRDEAVPSILAGGLLPAVLSLIKQGSTEGVQYNAARLLFDVTSEQPDVPAVIAVVPALIQKCSSTDTSSAVRTAVLEVLCSISEGNQGFLALGAANGVQLMLDIIRNIEANQDSNEQSSSQDDLLAATWSLYHMVFDNDLCEAAAAAGVMQLLPGLLRSSNIGVRYNAAGIMWSLCEVSAANVADAVAAGVFQDIVQMLVHSHDNDLQHQAAGALMVLAKHAAEVRVQAAAGGCIPVLVKMLSSSNVNHQEEAAGALASLALNNAANHSAIAAVPGAVEQLQKLLDSSVMADVRNAAAALMKLLSR